MRGVQQGDPLSCLLFNLAIEPLACLLRASPTLCGITIPGVPQKTIVNMYADDTTIYLSADDHYTDLETILLSWCIMSGTKFNLEKTEMLPIGTQDHRDRISATCQIHPTNPPLHEGICIAHDGQVIRCLGSWIGNGFDGATPWETILNKIKSKLAIWSSTHPTLDAKALIIQLTIGGMTQFLAKAQGMPKPITTALTKLTRDFIWDSR